VDRLKKGMTTLAVATPRRYSGTTG